MARGRKTPNDADLRVRCPARLVAEFEASAKRQGTTRSELLRRLVEREVANTAPPGRRRTSRRRRRLRRCISCNAFVRNSYTCRYCRPVLGDSILVAGNVVPIPSLDRTPMPVRPDLRDPRWADAESAVLDAFAPVVAIVYEVLSQDSALEVTDLDEIADILAMAASISG